MSDSGTWMHSILWFEIGLVAMSVAAGLLGALLGLGGGALLVPGLTLLFGINLRYAIGASIVSVIATSSGAAATYVRDHLTNLRLAMFLNVATVSGALTGALLAALLAAQWLYLLFALMLLQSAWFMIRRPDAAHAAGPTGDPWSRRLRLAGSYPDRVLARTVEYSPARVWLGFGLMWGAGVISALLGIGSGALKVVAMDSAMRLPIKVSSASSNFMIGVTAAASAGTYFTRGDIVPELAAPVSLGVLAGAWAGTHVMVRLSNQRIRYLFVAVLVVLGVQMALRGFGIQVR
jgi:uncharacterized membrane protein YfcA